MKLDDQNLMVIITMVFSKIAFRILDKGGENSTHVAKC